jgi:16S rRNA (adenine1518-N6/adenine1519-N6)-dimethyltransferase
MPVPDNAHTRSEARSEARSDARREHINPKKSLGQNFLVDKNIARKIAAALACEVGDAVVEVGPGEGALTALLLETPLTSLTAIEFDPRAVALLRTAFNHDARLTLVHNDVLKTALPAVLAGTESNESTVSTAQATSAINTTSATNVKLIGNIPYYITSDILLWLFEQYALLHAANKRLSKAVVMMQKEVAERLVAKPRTKEYGVLTVATAFVSRARILFHVSPQCFYPRPNVTSAVVEFEFFHDSVHDSVNAPQNVRNALDNLRSVQPLVRLAFNQRRKMLSNALSSVLARSQSLEPAAIVARGAERGLSFQRRAEELTTHDFRALYEFLRECGCVV